MKHLLILHILSTAHIAGTFRVQVPGMAGVPQEHDSTNLLQSKITVEATLDTDSKEEVGAAESTDYVPGTPGAPWTNDEVLVVKAKLWHVMSLTQQETGELYKSLHGPGFDEGSNFWRKTYINRMPATWLRLGFHGCLPEKDGSGGCDGCLFWDGLGKVFMDYFVQKGIPANLEGHNMAPNFNNGLGPAVELLEAIYKNASFPPKTPVLPKSLFELGKSRADLWAFAGINAAEYGAWLNNMICLYPEFEKKGVYWPDSVSANSAYGQHCNQFYGSPNCTVDLKEGFEFKTGRKDCIPFTLYHKIDKLECPRNLEIKTQKECLAAAKDLQLDQSKAKFVAEGDTGICKYSELEQGSYQSICYLSLDDKYNEGNHSHYVQHPITDQDEFCRDDLAVLSEKECRQAATELYLEFSDKKLAAHGCFLVEYSEWPHILLWRVHYGVGPPPTKGLYGMRPLYPDYGTGWGKHVKAVCRYENEPVQPYMARQFAVGPSSQMNGAGTVKFFKDNFNFSARHAAAIMGAHTMGRFHAIADILRYIWVRNGGMLLNNQYHRNIAQRPDYRFVDPDCRLLGDAYGNRGAIRWTAFRRWEMDNRGPISWILERYICYDDCHLESLKDHSCCQGIPQGGYCKPDNHRENVSKPWEVDDDVKGGCEVWNTETGQHESVVPAEIGLYFKFEVDENMEPYGCPGLDNRDDLDSFPSQMEVGCPKNDMPLDDGSDMKLYELIEQYADDQSVWIADFIASMNKVNQRGYEASELVDGPEHFHHVVCPTQESVIDPKLMYWTCFSTDEISKQLSAPFLLISRLDMKALQIDPITGELSVGEFKKGTQLPHQTWYIATTGGATTLVNGIMKWGVGNWTYDDTNHVLIGSGGLGLLLRDNGKLVFSNEKHLSFLSAGWSRRSFDDNSPMSPFPSCVALKSLHGKYMTVGSDGLLCARADGVSPSSEFQVISNDDGTVSLEGSGGRFVVVDEAGELKAHRDMGATSFTVAKNVDGTISLRMPSGNYVVAESTGELHAKKNVEKFEKHENWDGTVSFRSAWGKWLVAAWGGSIDADRWWNSGWGHFNRIENDDGTISLTTNQGMYWKAESSGQITALEDTELGPEHKFTEVQNDDGTISLKQVSGEFLLASGVGKMYGSKVQASVWSNFAPALCTIEGMAVVACPTACQTPVCVAGGGHNGGVGLVDGKCHEHCSTKWSGVRYCGHGDSYKLDGSIDCSGCAA